MLFNELIDANGVAPYISLYLPISPYNFNELIDANGIDRSIDRSIDG